MSTLFRSLCLSLFAFLPATRHAEALVAQGLVSSHAPVDGRLGGPGIYRGRVDEHATRLFAETFRAGEVAVVTMIGDGTTDLDLYVYDENGNLIAKDDDATDRCIVTFTPRWTGKFVLRLVNRGVVSYDFVLETN